jgi:tRNA(fMet)-specific endonuclease VapC
VPRRSSKRELVHQKLRVFFSRFKSMPFDDAAAQTYGVIRAALEKEDHPIGPNNMLIAAIALANGLTVLTHNTAELGRVPGLHLEDWEA